MRSFRDLIIFCAGATFFHTLNLGFVTYISQLPIYTKAMEFFSKTNLTTISLYGMLTLFLIWWAIRLKD